MRVLLVEDNVVIGNALQDHLQAEGWIVDWMLDLASSRTAVAANRYDIVLLDLRLPDGNGLDLLDHPGLRTEPTPVIVMSAYDQLSDRIASQKRGGTDYLVKPFSLSELSARMSKATARKGGGGAWDGRSNIHFGAG